MRFSALYLLAVIGSLLACGTSITGPNTGPLQVVFIVRVGDEQFHVLLQGAKIEQARRILRGEEAQKIISGPLAAGSAQYNLPWSWHLIPAETALVDNAIELCDGKPSFVEMNLDYWLGTVGRYCPWSAEIVGEVPALNRGSAGDRGNP